MKPRLLLAPRLAIGLCGLGSLLCSSATNAQPPANAPPAPAAAAYQDHYIGGGSLAPDISMGDGATSDTSGLARSLQVDGVVTALGSRSRSVRVPPWPCWVRSRLFPETEPPVRAEASSDHAP